MKLKDIMSKKLVTVDENEAVINALDIMHDKKISCIIATRDKQPSGIITERDVVGIYHKYGDLSKVIVKEVMSTPLKSLPGDTDVKVAIDLMNEHKIRHLIVDDDGKYGLVTQTNIVKVMATELLSSTSFKDIEKELSRK